VIADWTPNEVFYPGNALHWATLDVLGSCIFLRDMDLEDENGVSLVKSWVEMTKIAMQNKFLLLGDLLVKLPLKDSKDLLRHLNTFIEKLRSVIEEERQALERHVNHEPQNVVQTMIADGLDEIKIRGNIASLIVGGHETSYTTLMGILYNLAVHRDIQEKVREEIKNIKVEGDNQVFENDQVKELEYLTLFLKENLRSTGPTTSILLRETTEDLVVNDFFIPKGTLINCNMRSSYFYESIWEDPQNFRPERFIKLTQEQREIYNPFLIGPHICIGMQLSYLEQKIFVIRLLQKYSIEMAPDSVYEFNASSLTLQPNDKKLSFIVRPI